MSRNENQLPSIDEIVENFALLDQWDDRYRYVIELGRALAPLPETARTDANKVQGCASQVWLATETHADSQAGPMLSFVGDSDAHIVRGLIAILLAFYSGKHAQQNSRCGCDRVIQSVGTSRTSDPSALQWVPLDG